MDQHSLRVVIAVLLGVFLLSAVMGSLKGKFAAGVGGIAILFLPSFLSLAIGVALVSMAIRLAKPGSYWQRKFYDEAKSSAAIERFPKAQAQHIKDQVVEDEIKAARAQEARELEEARREARLLDSDT